MQATDAFNEKPSRVAVSGVAACTEADELAERVLIDDDAWVRSGFPDAATNLRIAELAIEANVHPSVVAGRVRFETRSYRRFAGLVGNGEARRFFPRDGIYAGADR